MQERLHQRACCCYGGFGLLHLFSDSRWERRERRGEKERKRGGSGCGVGGGGGRHTEREGERERSESEFVHSFSVYISTFFGCSMFTGHREGRAGCRVFAKVLLLLFVCVCVRVCVRVCVCVLVCVCVCAYYFKRDRQKRFQK